MLFMANKTSIDNKWYPKVHSEEKRELHCNNKNHNSNLPLRSVVYKKYKVHKSKHTENNT